VTQQWDPDRYACEVGFVAKLGEPLIDILAPQANERILDLGCGDGALTFKLIARGCEVVAVDSSAEQVEAACGRGLNAFIADGHRLQFDNEFNGVISNAALHWMKRPDEVLEGVARALVSDGRFVAELGGEGNVARIVAEIETVLASRSIDVDSVNPWYFPAPDEYASRLEAHGFEIVSLQHFPRPTSLSVDISAWLEIFTMSFFRSLEPVDRADALAELRTAVRDDLCDGAGNWEIDYVRLRFSAIKRAPR